VLAGAFVALQPRVAQFLKADFCLDHGGSYDYVRGQCDHKKNHPYIAWEKRSHNPLPVLMAGGLVVGGLIVVFFAEWPR
jgi:hypothetical protein